MLSAQFGFALYDSALGTDGERYIGRLFDAGFTWVETQYPRPLIAPARFRRFAAFLDELRARYSPAISVHLPITDLNPASENRALRRLTLRQWREGIRFAGDLGAALVVLHPGSIGPMDIPPRGHPAFEQAASAVARIKDRIRPYAIDVVRACSELAQSLGMAVAVENVISPGDLVWTPDDHAKMLEGAGDNVCAVLDVGHAERAGFGWRAFWERLGQRIRHIHLTDNDGVTDWHWPLGRGRIDFRGLVRALTASAYSGALVMEMVAGDWTAHVQGKAFLERVAQDAT
jgi:sugar phosphate isomerase/epimerase